MYFINRNIRLSPCIRILLRRSTNNRRLLFFRILARVSGSTRSGILPARSELLVTASERFLPDVTPVCRDVSLHVGSMKRDVVDVVRVISRLVPHATELRQVRATFTTSLYVVPMVVIVNVPQMTGKGR